VVVPAVRGGLLCGRACYVIVPAVWEGLVMRRRGGGPPSTAAPASHRALPEASARLEALLCYSLLSATASSLLQPPLCYSLLSATASSLLQPLLCNSPPLLYSLRPVAERGASPTRLMVPRVES
jgi:hypothetical protein